MADSHLRCRRRDGPVACRRPARRSSTGERSPSATRPADAGADPRPRARRPAPPVASRRHRRREHARGPGVERSPTPLSAVIVARVHDGRRADSPGVLTPPPVGRRRAARGPAAAATRRRRASLDGPRSQSAADFAHVFDVKAGRSVTGTGPSNAGPGWTITVDGGPPPTSIGHRRLRTVDDVGGALTWDSRSAPLASGPMLPDRRARRRRRRRPGSAFPVRRRRRADAVPMRRLGAMASPVPTVVSTDPRLSTVRRPGARRSRRAADRRRGPPGPHRRSPPARPGS